VVTEKQRSSNVEQRGSPWHLQGSHGVLDSRLRGDVDLLRPGLGFRLQACDEESIHATLLSVIMPGSPLATGPGEVLIESYSRGSDLVARYAETPDRSVRPECYWRYVDRVGDALIIEVLISVQTSLLASEPAIHTRSILPAGELARIDVEQQFRLHPLGSSELTASSGLGILVVRSQAFVNWTYAEMIYPSDYIGGRVTAGEASIELVFDLFPESLEKGVIRRARVRGCWVPRDGDREHIRQAYEQFVAAPLPLTA